MSQPFLVCCHKQQRKMKNIIFRLISPSPLDFHQHKNNSISVHQVTSLTSTNCRSNIITLPEIYLNVYMPILTKDSVQYWWLRSVFMKCPCICWSKIWFNIYDCGLYSWNYQDFMRDNFFRNKTANSLPEILWGTHTNIILTWVLSIAYKKNKKAGAGWYNLLDLPTSASHFPPW